MRRPPFAVSALLAAVLLAIPPSVPAAETMVTGGGGAVFPSNTTFNGIAITGLEFGFGLEFSDVGDKVGEVVLVLLGPGNPPRNIVLEGNVTGGSRLADGVATFSGIATLDMGDGLPPLSPVPFTVTVTTGANDQGALGLVIGAANLPAADVNDGTLTISAPAPPPGP